MLSSGMTVVCHHWSFFVSVIDQSSNEFMSRLLLLKLIQGSFCFINLSMISDP